MQNIQRKLKLKGASLDPSVLIHVNSDDRPGHSSSDEDFMSRQETFEVVGADKSGLRRMDSQRSRKPALRRMDTNQSTKSRGSAKSLHR